MIVDIGNVENREQLENAMAAGVTDSEESTMAAVMEQSSHEVLKFVEYNEFEAAADKTALKIKEGFMEMGFILKMARDTDILRDSGYSNHEEFAARRYDLDKGTVSRYIRIVERFSVDGNSHVLKESYRKMGFAKLSLMLHMPDAVAEELMDSLSKQEVLAIKEELDAESQISDIELAIERAEVAEQQEEIAENTGEASMAAVITDTLLQKAIHQLGKEQPQIYAKIFDLFDKDRVSELFEVIAPQGEAIYMVRPAGVGRLMLSIAESGVCVTNVRSQEKERYSMEELCQAVFNIVDKGSEDAAASYLTIYHEEFPQPEPAKSEKAEVAPVQPPKRKDSKVTKANPPKKVEKSQNEPENSQNETENSQNAPENGQIASENAQTETEEQIPGQDNILNHPEYLPEEMAETVINTECGEDSEDTNMAAVVEEAEKPDMAAVVEEPEKASMAAALTDSEEIATAAGMDEIDWEALWDDVENKLMDLERFVDSHYTHEVVESSIPRKELVDGYNNAVAVAAALERMLNGKKYTT